MSNNITLIIVCFIAGIVLTNLANIMFSNDMGHKTYSPKPGVECHVTYYNNDLAVDCIKTTFTPESTPKRNNAKGKTTKL